MSNTSHIGSITDGEFVLRGHKITSLIDQDFISVAWLAWSGTLPTESQKKVLNACVVLCVDHGEAPPSAHVTRTVASCGKPLADAVAAGLLTFGPRHGNAGSTACEWMKEAVEKGETAEAIVDRAIEKKQRLAGIGHPEYDVDPRSLALLKLMKHEFASTPHCDLAERVAVIFSEKKQKPLPLNIDGALAAALADLGAPAEFVDALFLCARTIGLTAHAMDEIQNGGASYRREGK